MQTMAFQEAELKNSNLNPLNSGETTVPGTWSHLTGQTRNALRVHCWSAGRWCHSKKQLFGLGNVLYVFCLSVYQSIFIYLLLLPAMMDRGRWLNLN